MVRVREAGRPDDRTTGRPVQCYPILSIIKMESRQQAAGSGQRAAGSRQQAAGSGQPGSRQRAAGSRQQAAGNTVFSENSELDQKF